MAYSNFSNALFNMARAWASKWTQLANQRLVSSPQRVSGGPQSLKGIIEIHTRVERKSAQRFSLILTAKGKGQHVAEYGHGTNLAMAYEYGSGENAQFGGGKYIIKPRPPKKYLAFIAEYGSAPLALTPKTGKPSKRTTLKGQGIVFAKKVMHPGVEAANQGKGYARDARYRLMADAKHELSENMRKAIVADIKIVFKGSK